MNKKRIIIALFCLMTTIHAMALYQIKYMKVGDVYAMTISPFTSLGESVSSVSWSGASGCVARIGGGGTSYSCTVQAIKAGYTTVTCNYTIKNMRTGSSTYYSDSWSITVEENKPTSIYLSQTKVEADMGSLFTLTASVYPSNATYTLSWSSSNTSVATVSGGSVIASSPGTATIICTTDNGLSAECEVIVYNTNPTGFTLEKPSTMIVGDVVQLAYVFTPEYTRSNITWTSSNETAATVDATGKVTALWPGTTTISARTANGLSQSVEAKVVAPDLVVTGTNPESGQTGITVLTSPQVTYSHPVTLAEGASAITFSNGGGTMKGTISVSNCTLTFTPECALKPNTSYTLFVPANAVKTKWGNFAKYSESLSFTTGALEPLTLTSSLEAGYVEKGDKVVLTASDASAVIRYTIDGTEPKETSTVYTEPLVINTDKTVWARAYKDGYETPEFRGEYKISHARVTDRFPGKDQMYIYKDVNPSVAFEVNVVAGPQFNQLAVIMDASADSEGTPVSGEFIVSGNHLTFVPTEPLLLGHNFKVVVPSGAVTTRTGEPNKESTWTFTTGTFIRSITAGYQNAAAVRTDNTLLFWGRKMESYNGGNITDNNYWLMPTTMATGVKDASMGFTHGLITKTDGSTFGWGLQFCDELTSSMDYFQADMVKISDINADKPLAGGQTSAALKDGQLTIWGRNDFGQLSTSDDMTIGTPTVCPFINNVKQVELGWQTTLALQENGDLYAFGDNTNGLLGDGTTAQRSSAVHVMGNVSQMAVSRWSNSNAAAVTNDGSLYVWGLNQYGQKGDGSAADINDEDCVISTPKKIMDDVSSVAVSDGFIAAVKTDGSLWMWGNNAEGQLGLGTTETTTTPQKVMDNVAAVSLGKDFTVVLTTDGSVWTWGVDNWSQLGDNWLSERRTSPRQIIEGRAYRSLTSLTMKTTDIYMTVGERAVACAQPTPIYANYEAWSWTSSDPSIVTVNARGVITAVAEGTAIVTLHSDDDMTAVCKVTVGNGILLGDADGDTKVDVNDVTSTINYILNKPVAKFIKEAADMDKDGKIDVNDVQAIIYKALGKE